MGIVREARKMPPKKQELCDLCKLEKSPDLRAIVSTYRSDARRETSRAFRSIPPDFSLLLTGYEREKNLEKKITELEKGTCRCWWCDICGDSMGKGEEAKIINNCTDCGKYFESEFSELLVCYNCSDDDNEYYDGEWHCEDCFMRSLDPPKYLRGSAAKYFELQEVDVSS